MRPRDQAVEGGVGRNSQQRVLAGRDMRGREHRQALQRDRIDGVNAGDDGAQARIVAQARRQLRDLRAVVAELGAEESVGHGVEDGVVGAHAEEFHGEDVLGPFDEDGDVIELALEAVAELARELDARRAPDELLLPAAHGGGPAGGPDRLEGVVGEPRDTEKPRSRGRPLDIPAAMHATVFSRRQERERAIAAVADLRGQMQAPVDELLAPEIEEKMLVGRDQTRFAAGRGRASIGGDAEHARERLDV